LDREEYYKLVQEALKKAVERAQVHFTFRYKSFWRYLASEISLELYLGR